MEKVHVHLFVEKDNWALFQKNCKKKDLVPSRELNRYMKITNLKWNIGGKQ